MPQRYHDNEDDADASSCDESAPLSSLSATHPHWFRRLTARRNILPFFLALIATLIVVLALTLLTALDSSPQRKIVILMVSDGMGPASLSMARTFRQYTQDLEYSAQLPLDPYIVGTSRTRSYGLPSQKTRVIAFGVDW
jgi:alkaline phosphatase